MAPCGVILLNKPPQVRSTACVSMLRRILGKKIKVGHGGALDSTAQGLLLLLAGNATRTSELVMDLPKVYDVHFRLGEERTTDDFSGDVLYSKTVPPDAGEQIDGLIPSFLGTRMQVPPQISAIKVGGERAHKLARAGKEPKLSPRPIHISSISLTRSEEGDALFGLRIACSRGTYIRSVVRDIGRRLGCGAYVQFLARHSIGRFNLEDAMDFTHLQDRNPIEIVEKNIRPLSDLALQFYSFTCDEAGEEDLRKGKSLPLSSLAFLSPGDHDPRGGGAVLGKGLFSYGRLLAGGLFEPKTNILLEENS